jgi:hypothetical protein
MTDPTLTRIVLSEDSPRDPKPLHIRIVADEDSDCGRTHGSTGCETRARLGGQL